MIRKMKCLPVFIVAVVFLLSGMAYAERVSVNVPLANVRSGPGTGSEILWKVEKYHPLEIVSKSGDWYQFRDFEGDTGWIFKGLVRNYASVIVIKNNVNVRSGPGTGYDIIFKVEKGVPFRVMERKDNWIKIRHSDGDDGWIYKSLVW
jgi:SH3-like domain-containing protein